MARWRLTAPHYLMLDPPVEWERVETDMETGEQLRYRHVVPKLLDPRDGRSINAPEGVVVSNKRSGRDYVFKGPPTADMEPLDAEAQALSDKERPKWINPLDHAYTGNFGDALLEKLTRQLDALATGKQPEPISAGSVSAAEFAKLQKQVEELMAANLKLQGKALPARP